MNIIGIVVVSVLVALVCLLAWLVYNFHKYKSKLFARVWKVNGNVKEVDITDNEGGSTFNVGNKSYTVVKSKVHNVSWLFPKKALLYLEGKTKPLGHSGEDDETDLGGHITPIELNKILGIEFVDLFKTESEGFLSGISISKKWLFVILIIGVIASLLLLYGGDLLDLIGAGGGQVVKPNG